VTNEIVVKYMEYVCLKRECELKWMVLEIEVAGN